MKQPKRDITILLTTLLIFSISVGLIHTNKKVNLKTVVDTSGTVDQTQQAHQKLINEPLERYNPEQIITYIYSLVQAESTKEIGMILARLDSNKIKQVLDILCSKKEFNLEPDEIASIVVHAAHELQDEQKAQELFDYAAMTNCLKNELPVLAIAGDLAYADVINALKKWMENNPGNTLMRDTLIALVKNNNPTAIAKLLSYDFIIDKAILNEALWHAVDQAASPDFVSIFNQYGADINYAYNNKTLLMRAVELASQEIVRALLDAGAQSNILLDPQVGTALQFALENKADNKTEIELLLRTAGAHE